MTLGMPGVTFGFTGFPVLLLLANIGLTLWAVTVAAQQHSLTVLERVLLIGIAVFAPFIGPVAVLISTPLLAKRREA